MDRIRRYLPVFGSAAEGRRRNWLPYAFVAPLVLFLVLLLWFPFMRGIWISFHSTASGPNVWVGLDNYEFILTWDVFYVSMKATLIYATITIFQLVIGLGAALIVREMNRFDGIMSGLMLIPYTMPPVVTGTIWIYLLDPSVGPIFSYLTDWGLLAEPVYWGTQGDTALAVIMFVGTWTFWPFMFLILVANLQQIPKEHYETARIYGASRLDSFLRITLPQLKSAIIIAVSIRLIWNLSKISQPLQLTGGGPGFDTSILAILLYRFTWERGQYGLAYAMGIILFTLTFIFIVLLIREFDTDTEGMA